LTVQIVFRSAGETVVQFVLMIRSLQLYFDQLRLTCLDVIWAVFLEEKLLTRTNRKWFTK
jgi:hypothetical protein